MELHQITTRCPFQPTACYNFSYYSTKLQSGGERIWDWPAEVLDNFHAGWLTDPFSSKENGMVRNGPTLL